MLSPKQKLYSISGSFLITIILIFVAVIFPLIEKIKSSNLTLEKQKMVSENFYQNWKNLTASKITYTRIEREMDNQGIFLPKNEALNFIMAIEKMAQETGNRQNISITNNSSAENKIALKLQTSLYGNFSNLLNFLARIENAAYFNDIDSLQISRASAKGDPEGQIGNINSIIDLSAYYE